MLGAYNELVENFTDFQISIAREEGFLPVPIVYKNINLEHTRDEKIKNRLPVVVLSHDASLFKILVFGHRANVQIRRIQLNRVLH